MSDPQLEAPILPTGTSDQQEPTKEQQEKLRKIFNRIIPHGVYRFLIQHPDEFQDIRSNLAPGENKIIDVTEKYANDSIDFSSLWERNDIDEETKQTLHKKLLQTYIELGGWISQRDPEKTYINIWIDSNSHAMPSDEERNQMYQEYLQITVPTLLEDMGLTHLRARDVVFLAQGNTIDPSKEPDKTGKLVFMKDHQNRVLAAQNMPSSSEFIFAATIHKAHKQLRDLSHDALPIVTQGNDYTIDIAGKNIRSSISFAKPTKRDVSKSIQHPAIDDTTEVSSWAYDTLLCDSYFTPKEFYELLLATHPDIDLESQDHEVIDIIIKHVHQLKSESYSITITGSATGVDLSGMSLITKELEQSNNPRLRMGFTKLLEEWQLQVATIYRKNGYACDDLAGDGLNAYDFPKNGDEQDPKKQIDMAFIVQQTWNDLMHAPTVDPDITALKTFLRQQQLDRSFIKTALTEQNAVTLRWYSNKVDILPEQQLGPLLDQAKQYHLTHADEDTIIIVSRKFYETHKHMVDTNYVVHPQDNGNGIILSQLTQQRETSQSPRETLSALAE